ncbi:MAG: ThuA domain-containing protein [Planctomycetota bacterium]|nr:ThuA domain-containing protein [Planctomycetota bacterium]
MKQAARLTIAILPAFVCFLGILLLASMSLAKNGTVTPLGGAASTQPALPHVKVLIIDGVSNHNWKLNTVLLRGLLEPMGLFDVAVSTSPARAGDAGWEQWRPRFSDFDVVIQTYNDIKGGPPWPEDVKKSFVDFVKQGGGVFIYHSANNAFAKWPEYNDIIGLGWRGVGYGTALRMSADGTITRLPPGEGRATSHAPRADVLVHCLGDHPIHQGLAAAWKSPLLEVYYDARGPAKNVEVISYGQDPRFKDYWPLEWTVTYGRGRVYASSFGHVWADESETKQPVDLLAADEQTLIPRAIQWLAKRPITIEVSKDFPTAEKTSIRANIRLPKTN